MSDSERAKISPSGQFRVAAEALASATSLVLNALDERDKAEIEVASLKAQLEAAESRLVVYERRLEMVREMMEPQSKLHLSIMEGEANDNLVKLRAIKETA